MDRNYEELAIIGRGAYGTVFKAHDVDNDRMVALKRVRIMNNSEEKGVPASTLREITLLKQLDNMTHPNIVRMFDAFQTFSSNSHASSTDPSTELVLTIVFEHVDQDLSMFLQRCPPPGLPETLIKDLMHQLLSGLDYLHVNRLTHRDIKPQNVLITKDKQVKIADFGLARVYGFCKLITSVVVTLWYRAPELLLQCPYATLVDLWSVGAIMAEMYNRRPLFPGKSEVDQLHKILEIIGVPDQRDWPENSSLPWENFKKCKGINLKHLVPEISDEGLDLMKNLLLFDPNKRFNARESLAHSYFHEITRSDSQDSGISTKSSKSNDETSNDANSLSSDELFQGTDSGIGCADTSSSSEERTFLRTDSGICVSPVPAPTGLTGTSCCVNNNNNNDKTKDVVSSDDIKSPPRKLQRREELA